MKYNVLICEKQEYLLNKVYCLLLILIPLVTACQSVRKWNDVNQATNTDREETIHVRDSTVCIIRDSTIVRHQSDTLVIERWRDRWIDRVVERSDTVIVNDTIRVTETKYIETTKPNNTLPALAVIAVCVLLVILRIKR